MHLKFCIAIQLQNWNCDIISMEPPFWKRKKVCENSVGALENIKKIILTSCDLNSSQYSLIAFLFYKKALSLVWGEGGQPISVNSIFYPSQIFWKQNKMGFSKNRQKFKLKTVWYQLILYYDQYDRFSLIFHQCLVVILVSGKHLKWLVTAGAKLINIISNFSHSFCLLFWDTSRVRVRFL